MVVGSVVVGPTTTAAYEHGICDGERVGHTDEPSGSTWDSVVALDVPTPASWHVVELSPRSFVTPATDRHITCTIGKESHAMSIAFRYLDFLFAKATFQERNLHHISVASCDKSQVTSHPTEVLPFLQDA